MLIGGPYLAGGLAVSFARSLFRGTGVGRNGRGGRFQFFLLFLFGRPGRRLLPGFRGLGGRGVLFGNLLFYSILSLIFQIVEVKLGTGGNRDQQRAQKREDEAARFHGKLYLELLIGIGDDLFVAFEEVAPFRLESLGEHFIVRRPFVEGEMWFLDVFVGGKFRIDGQDFFV